MEIETRETRHWFLDEPLEFLRAIGDDYVVFRMSNDRLVIAETTWQSEPPYALNFKAVMIVAGTDVLTPDELTQQ